MNSHRASIETKIAARLWEWKFAEPMQRHSIILDSELATLLEFWFPFSEIEHTRQLGTWCDGVPLLRVDQLDRVRFSVSGVGYFPHQLAAF